MSLNLLSRLGLDGSSGAVARPRRKPSYRSRLSIEELEGRLVLSSSAIAPPVADALVAHAAASTQHVLAPVQMLPLSITGISVQNGDLVAHARLDGVGSIPITIPLTLTAQPNAADPTCPILNLKLAPIHLNLLGLHVDTSPICLRITAQSGAGNLLGNLLCDVANLLNGGTSLGTVLGGLTSTQLSTLTHGLNSMLNSVFRDITTVDLASGLGATPSVTGASCNILRLSLGPVNLNLLGLHVRLDNCSSGPVRVNITAVPGAGNLLGNLLCDLANLLNGNPLGGLAGIEHSLQSIAHRIFALV